MIRRSVVIVWCVCAVLGRAVTVSAAVEADDGFIAAKRLESRYFTILIEDGVDTDDLARSLIISPSIRAIVQDPTALADPFSITGQFDTLYRAVSEILDISLPKFNCTVKVCKDAESLSRIISRLGGDPARTAGIYVAELNTLYINARNISIYVVGRELSLAVQSDYFAVPPPKKVQEILAGYAEYELRKYSGSLPPN